MIRFLVGVILACVAFWIAVPTLLFGVLPGAAGLGLVAGKSESGHSESYSSGTTYRTSK